MLEGQIVGALAPVEIRFLVPSASEMYSAGSMDTQGVYSGGPPHRETSPIPGWDEISYEVQTDTFRVEYYNPIIIEKSHKTISYEFRTLYPISELEIIVQEPRKSSDFSVLPEGKTFVDNQGFNSHLYNYFSLDEEQPLQFEITYNKSQTQPSLAIEENGASSSLPLIIFIIALGIGVTGVLLWTRKSRPKGRETRRQLSRTTIERNPKRTKIKGGFCTHCGQQIEESHLFCPYCGAKRPEQV
ncbi:zinc ribbon domain-containing protein [Chloroflexota bacterium]